MAQFQSLLDDFLSIIYPRHCMACGKSLYKHEKNICAFCLYHLPKTNFHQDENNPVSRLFWGKANVQAATSMLYFHKGSNVQHLMHQLKYKSKQELGVYLGNLYGKELQSTPDYNQANVIIPVPLHPKKQLKRGYNQSECFARGLSELMNIPVDTKTLMKSTATESQTRKSRFSRWENTKEAFELKDYSHLTNKHILLVDDVITTGATLENCTTQLEKIPGIKISIATIAYASN